MKLKHFRHYDDSSEDFRKRIRNKNRRVEVENTEKRKEIKLINKKIYEGVPGAHHLGTSFAWLSHSNVNYKPVSDKSKIIIKYQTQVSWHNYAHAIGYFRFFFGGKELTKYNFNQSSYYQEDYCHFPEVELKSWGAGNSKFFGWQGSEYGGRNEIKLNQSFYQSKNTLVRLVIEEWEEQ